MSASQYNDDGPSGPLFEAFLFFGASVLPPLLAATIAAALVSFLLRHEDG